jgi:hypothetical protein
MEPRPALPAVVAAVPRPCARMACGNSRRRHGLLCWGGPPHHRGGGSWRLAVSAPARHDARMPLTLRRALLSPADADRQDWTYSTTARRSGASTKIARKARRESLDGFGRSPGMCLRGSTLEPTIRSSRDSRVGVYSQFLLGVGLHSVATMLVAEMYMVVPLLQQMDMLDCPYSSGCNSSNYLHNNCNIYPNYFNSLRSSLCYYRYPSGA